MKMKKRKNLFRMALLLTIFAFALDGCGSTNDAKNGVQGQVKDALALQPAPGPASAPVQEAPVVEAGKDAPAAQQTAPAAQKSAAPPPAPRSPYFEGDGGKGMSITILPPKATGLAKDHAYLPGVVQGELVSNFSGYSAISVLDRVKLDDVYDELFSGYYDENAEASWDLGHLAPTEFILGGSITKTASGYALQIQITKTGDKTTAASYSGTCTFAELDNLSGVRRAALDLLQKLGVEPTERTLAELGTAATANQAAAQVALSKGIEAARKGTVVEALSYYYEAGAFDPALLEAASRASTVSAAISSGNIGENVRNDIQRRKEWEKLLTEAEDYFSKHLPWQIVYDPTLTEGKIDYAKETVDLSFNMEVKPTNDWNVVQTLIDGLEATGKRDEWGFTWWPLTSRVFMDYTPNSSVMGRYVDRAGQHGKITKITFALINEKGKALASETVNCINKTAFDVGGDTREYWKPLPEKGYRAGYTIIRNDIISTAAVSEIVVFKNVNANDITDTMTVKIVSVNGINADTAGKTGYIRISTP